MSNQSSYSGAYSRRRFSNYSPDSKQSADNAPAPTGAFTLSVTSGDPSMGEVGFVKLTSSSPLSTNQASQATADRGGYASGTKFRAVAKALPGYRFVQWQTNIDGVGNTNTNPIEFTLNKNTWLIARFEKVNSEAPSTKTANISWNGQMGRVNGNGLVLDDTGRANSGVLSATQGSSVTLAASPLDGFRFVKWVGAPVDGKTAKTITFQMNNNYTIRAEFASNDPTPGAGLGTGGGGGVGGGAGAAADDPQLVVSHTQNENGVMAFVKKWWWAILIAAYIIWKDQEGGRK